MATDALGPSNAPDDDGLETPSKILYSDLSTGAAFAQRDSATPCSRHMLWPPRGHMHITQGTCILPDAEDTMDRRMRS